MKAQMKIQQMAFMLIAVTLFFALVGVFVIAVKFSGLKQSATELEEKNAMLLVTKLANSPELSCEGAFGVQRTNCVDADKVMMLKNDIDRYSKFWEVSNIEIRKIYPESEVLCEIGTYPNCGIMRILDKGVSGFDASNFVTLCRKENQEDNTYDKCELARLMVSYENIE